MPYPMWIPYKDMASLDEQKRFLEQARENWLEIERWAATLNLDGGCACEHGTYVPVITANSGNPLDYSAIGTWTTFAAGGVNSPVGDLVIAKFQIEWGLGSTSGSGTYVVSLPFPGFTEWAAGYGMITSSDANEERTTHLRIPNFGSTNDSSTDAYTYYADPAVRVTSSAPWTWGDGDLMHGTLVYNRNATPIFPV